MSRTPRAWATRLGGVVGAGVLCATVIAPAPVAARVELPVAGALLNAASIAIGVNESTPGKTARLAVFACCAEAGPLPDRVAVRVDAASAADVLVVRVSGAACTTSGQVTTCAAVPLSDAFLDSSAELRLNLKVAAGAAVGGTGVLRVTVSGTGLQTGTEDFAIQVVASGADLVAEDFRADANPGEVRSFQPTIMNHGDGVAKIVGVFLTDDFFGSVTQRYRNCRYETLDFGSRAYCEFDLNLGPGEAVRVTADSAVSVKVRPDAPHRWFTFVNYFVDAFDSPLEGVPGTPGDGPPLTLEQVAPGVGVLAGDVDRNDNSGSLAIRIGANPSDLAAVGGIAAGGVGDVVPLTVGIRNNGPAFVLNITDSAPLPPEVHNPPAATVTLPEGLTAVELHPEEPRQGSPSCAPIVNGKPDWSKRGQPIGRVFLCTTGDDMAVGDSWQFRFKVKVTAPVSAAGTVVASGGFDDPNRGNNTAPITIDAGGAGGGLPVTGASVGLIAGLGALTMVLGITLYLATRRRRFAT